MIKLWAFCMLAFLGSNSLHGAETLLWHPVRLDADGRLLAWNAGETSAPYAAIVTKAWTAFKQVPAQPDGFKTYLTYPVFYGPQSSGKNPFAGRDWTHNPAGLFAMLTDSAQLYFAYSGDTEVMPLVKAMLDHHIANGLTDATDAWALVPYASSDAGRPQYRGATEKRYTMGEEKFLGRGDGVGVIEPDKVGELGLAFLQYYEYSSNFKYLEAARHCADALAMHVQPGDESHSPWPFRVDAKTGTHVREAYTANTIGPIRLLEEMLRLGYGDAAAYARARDMAWAWLMQYPVQNHVFTQYFEDIYIYPDYRENINQYCALETARYLLQHPERDPQWREHVGAILQWVRSHFAIDSHTMAGLPEKGLQWGAEALSEQINDMDKMSSHTARYASLQALWYECTGDTAARDRAFRSFNWATYSCRADGLVKTSIDEGTGYWFSDGYGDYMRHFQRGMASVPEWAPSNENHLLRSSSIIRSIQYGKTKIQYQAFDSTGHELFKLKTAPKAVLANGKALSQLADSDKHEPGYRLQPCADGAVLVTIQRAESMVAEIKF